MDKRTGEITIQYGGTYYGYGQICFEEQEKQIYFMKIIENNDAYHPLASCMQGFSNNNQRMELIEERMICCTFSFAFRSAGNSKLSLYYSVRETGKAPVFYVTNSSAYLGFVKMGD